VPSSHRDPTLPRVYTLRPGIEILPVADGRLNPKARLVVAGDKYYQVDGVPTLLLIALQKGPARADQIRERIAGAGEPDPGEQKIEHALARLKSLSLVFDNSGGQAEGDAAKKPKTRRASYLAFYVRLLSWRQVHPFTQVLSPLFSPVLVISLLPVLGLGQVYFWFFHLRTVQGLHHLPGGLSLLVLVVANYAGLVLHELGHATACSRFGARHGEIGFAMYLIFPALYTDVTDSWRLTARQRMIVDSGGIYMSLMAATVASLFFLYNSSPLAAQMCFIYDFTVLFNLNPFFRMDGYWILSDLLGIPNLMASTREMNRWLLRLPFRRDLPRPGILSLPKGLRLAYLGYYGAFLLFVAYLVHRFYAWYAPHVLAAYPAFAEEILRRALTEGMSPGLFKDLFRLAAQAVPIAGPAVYLVRVIKRHTQSRRTDSENHTKANLPAPQGSLPASLNLRKS
jgi:putative peptide zinc metalloprotease protein